MNEIQLVEDGIEVAVPVYRVSGHANKYGTVSGLDEEELASPKELERMVFLQDWGPVLALPSKAKGVDFQGNLDDDGRIDFGAFATVDFDKYRPTFDKARYKEDRLKDRLKDLVIMLTIMYERVPGRNKAKVLKYVRMGIIDMGHITDVEMYRLAELYLRTLRIRKEIQQLQESRRLRNKQRLEGWLES